MHRRPTKAKLACRREPRLDGGLRETQGRRHIYVILGGSLICRLASLFARIESSSAGARSASESRNQQATPTRRGDTAKHQGLVPRHRSYTLPQPEGRHGQASRAGNLVPGHRPYKLPQQGGNTPLSFHEESSRAGRTGRSATPSPSTPRGKGGPIHHARGKGGPIL